MNQKIQSRLSALAAQYEDAVAAWNATDDPEERDRLSDLMNAIREEQISLDLDADYEEY